MERTIKRLRRRAGEPDQQRSVLVDRQALLAALELLEPKGRHTAAVRAATGEQIDINAADLRDLIAEVREDEQLAEDLGPALLRQLREAVGSRYVEVAREDLLEVARAVDPRHPLAKGCRNSQADKLHVERDQLRELLDRAEAAGLANAKAPPVSEPAKKDKTGVEKPPK